MPAICFILFLDLRPYILIDSTYSHTHHTSHTSLHSRDLDDLPGAGIFFDQAVGLGEDAEVLGADKADSLLDALFQGHFALEGHVLKLEYARIPSNSIELRCFSLERAQVAVWPSCGMRVEPWSRARA